MNMRHHTHTLLSFALTLIVLTGTHSASSTELSLSNVPLFLDSGVDPNILLVIDDSGSMDYDTLYPSGVSNHGNSVNFTPESNEDAYKLCPGINRLAYTYDPNNLYTPWVGNDRYGDAYPSITDLTSAPDNPYSPNSATDISGHVYFTWNDSDGDKKYDSGECPNLPLITAHENGWHCDDPDDALYWDKGNKWNPGKWRCNPSGWGYDYDADYGDYERDVFNETACENDTQCVVVDNLSEAQKENYANWYTYYRKRDFVAKKAALSLVNDSSARMGLGTINNNGSFINQWASIGTVIKDIDDDDDSTTQDAIDKTTLMNNISQIHPSSYTPLRRSIERAGEYYKNGDGALFGEENLQSPILSASDGGQCQQNFTILMTDGYSNENNSNSYKPSSYPGDRDGDDNTDYDGGIYADEESNTMADYAMKYYEEDLVPTLTDGVPNSNGGTEKMHQHMITYTVAFGVKGTLTCQPGVEKDDKTICDEEWPENINYSGEKPESIDDLWHAAVNGRGKYLNAADPAALIQSLQDAIKDIEGRTSSSAAVAANSTTLNQGTVIYQALFNSGDWHGNLRSMPVSIGATDTRTACADVPAGTICNAADWSASTRLDNQNYDTGRVILTYNSASSEDAKGIAFRWPSDYSSPGTYELGTTEITSLLGNAETGEEQTYGQALVDFLRGDTSNETTDLGFRERSETVLGDIINSAPAYVGAPRFNYPDNLENSPYSTYQSGSAATRTKIVYVGANDGMLHGFSVSNGDEKIAYVPSMVYKNLEKLSETQYTEDGNHRYFVDGSPTVGDAYFGSSWHTVLVSGLNSGGQGIFALDVTYPSKFTETQTDIDDVVLWEYTDADLGYTYSQPDIVKMNNGKWAAIFGNGYNNTEADGNASTTGYAYLYVVDIETGELIRKISTDTGSTTTPNGLATATPVDVDGDYKVDYIYAGDLQGNLWKFDLTASNPANWDVIKSGGNPRPLFTAKAPETGHPAQPITSRPSVSFHPDPQKGGLMVYFGTGRYIDEVDSVATGQNTQTFYGIWDDLSTLPPIFSGNRNTNSSDYLKQEILSEPTVSGTNTNGVAYSNTVRTTSDHDIDWSQHHGWYLDLVNTGANSLDNRGERQVTNSIVRGNRIIFSTLMPNDVACDFGGSSFLMELSAESGGRLGEPPLDINNDGDIDDTDTYNSGTIPSGLQQSGIITEPSIIGGDDVEYKLMNSSTGSTITVVETPPDEVSGKRKSWTEIIQ